MSRSSGVGGGPSTPENIPQVSDVGGDGGQQDIRGLMQAKVSNLSELKSLLISHLGEKEGTKFYNQFMTSFTMIMLQQVQHAAQHAKEASQNMRMRT